MNQKQKRQGGNPGADETIADTRNYNGTAPRVHAWRRWFQRVRLDRLSRRQIMVAILVRLGRADTPEQALRIVEGDHGER